MHVHVLHASHVVNKRGCLGGSISVADQRVLCKPPPITDWASVEPMQYLNPFLEVVRSPEVSGPVTGVALTGLHRMLSSYIFGE